MLGAVVTSVSPAVGAEAKAGALVLTQGAPGLPQLSRRLCLKGDLKRKRQACRLVPQHCPVSAWNVVPSLPAFISQIIHLSLPAPDVSAHLEAPWSDAPSAALPDP